MTTRVILVRPWSAGHAAGGCCSGDPAGVADECGPVGHRDPASAQAGACYLALRERLPEVDVQVVSAGNAPYLLPALYRSARASTGVLGSLRAAVRGPGPGAVLVDGERVGDLDQLGPDGVLGAVSARLAGRA